MGSGVSTNVKTISIDQSDEKWDKPFGLPFEHLEVQLSRGNDFLVAKDGHGSLHGSNASSRAISAVGGRLRKGAATALGATSRASSADRRYQQLRSLYESTEKKCNDAEQYVRNLQRELSTMEMRNSELVSEIAWLKEQIGCPEMPIPDEPTAFSAPQRLGDPNGRDRDNGKIARLETKLKGNEAELADLRAQLLRDSQAYKAQLNDVSSEYETKIDQLDENLALANRLNVRFEETVRNLHGDDFYLSLRNEAVNSIKPTVKPASRTHGNIKSHLILEMNNEINEKNAKIKRLDETLIYRDRAIAELKAQLAGRDNGSAQLHKSSTVSITSQEDTRTPWEHRPMSMESNATSIDHNNGDAINAVLETPNDQYRIDTPPNFPAHDGQTSGPVLERSQSIGEPMANEVCKSNRRILSSMPKRLDVKNIFSLSEAMEPIRMEDELPRTPIGPRPATTDTVRSNTPLSPLSGTDKHTSGDNRAGMVPGLGRGFSAPTLFKPSKSRTNRRGHGRHAIAPSNRGDWDLQSICGNDEHTPTTITADLPPAPPSANARRLSRASNKVTQSSDDDDYVDDLLNESVPNFSVFMSKTNSRASSQSASRFRRRESPGSAKSRDSGYLDSSSLHN